jgi:hypothetical protein
VLGCIANTVCHGGRHGSPRNFSPTLPSLYVVARVISYTASRRAGVITALLFTYGPFRSLMFLFLKNQQKVLIHKAALYKAVLGLAVQQHVRSN